MTPSDVGRLAFYGANLALNHLLTARYPDGCTLAEAIAWAERISPETIAGCLAVG